MMSMELSHAFLAQAAEVHPDGRLFVMGGGFEIIQSPVFPISIPVISVVIGLRFGRDDVKESYSPSLKLIRPNGASESISMTVVLPTPTNFPGPTTLIHAVATINGLSLASEGIHSIEVTVDGKPIGSLQFLAKAI